MDIFVGKLNDVADSYYGFVEAVLTYVNNEKMRQQSVEKYMDEHPMALSSDILEYIAEQKDFYRETVYVHAEVC